MYLYYYLVFLVYTVNILTYSNEKTIIKTTYKPVNKDTVNILLSKYIIIDKPKYNIEIIKL